MDPGRHAGLVELIAYCVPLVRGDHIQMVDVRRSLSNKRRLDPRLRQLRGVPLCSAPPIGVPLIQSPELDPLDGRLWSVEPACELVVRAGVVTGPPVVLPS